MIDERVRVNVSMRIENNDNQIGYMIYRKNLYEYSTLLESVERDTNMLTLLVYYWKQFHFSVLQIYRNARLFTISYNLHTLESLIRSPIPLDLILDCWRDWPEHSK